MTLQAVGISKYFGGVRAVNGASFRVDPGTLVSLVGPNGAGKTTCFNVVTGFLPPTSGQVLLDGVDITSAKPHDRVRRGLTRTFQTTSLFNRLTALENVQIALSRIHRLSRREILLPFARNTELEERGYELLKTVGIAHRASAESASMAYGDQRRLAVAIALGTQPRFLLLDEPAAGLNHTESAQFGALLRKLVADGLGILLVEHDMSLVMKVSDHIHVLAAGRTLAEGTAYEIRRNPEVVAAYLGRSNDAED